MRLDHVPTAPGLFCTSGDSPLSLVPWLFGTWGPWAAGRQKPRIGCSLPGRVGSHPRALPFPPSARRGPASRACSCLTPRLGAVTSASAVPPALGPQRPHTARLSGGTRCLSSARQALLHLYNQVFFFVLSGFVGKERVSFLICCWTLIHESIVSSRLLLAGIAKPAETAPAQTPAVGPGPAHESPAGRLRCLFFYFLCSGCSGVCGENVLARTSRVLETATAAV